MSSVFGIIIFFIVIMLTAVVFCAWLVFVISRGLMNWVASMLSGDVQPQAALGSGARCMTQGCRTMNPPTARFCRRCGRGMPQAQRVQVRRAAVW